MRPKGSGGVGPSASVPLLGDGIPSTASRCLASGPTASRTRPLPLLGQAPRRDEMNQVAAEAWWAPERAVPDPGEVRAPAAEAPLRAPGAVPFWAVMTFTFILVISPQSFVPALGPLRIALLAAGAAIGTYVYQRFRQGEPLL